jgi:hypothetical protein
VKTIFPRGDCAQLGGVAEGLGEGTGVNVTRGVLLGVGGGEVAVGVYVDVGV